MYSNESMLKKMDNLITWLGILFKKVPRKHLENGGPFFVVTTC